MKGLLNISCRIQVQGGEIKKNVGEFLDIDFRCGYGIRGQMAGDLN